jgi:uncharacterized membrane protein YvlD (DUF360 family)
MEPCHDSFFAREEPESASVGIRARWLRCRSETWSTGKRWYGGADEDQSRSGRRITSEFLSRLSFTSFWSIPQILMWIVTIVVAMKRRQSARAASTYVIAAGVIGCLNALCQPILQSLLWASTDALGGFGSTGFMVLHFTLAAVNIALDCCCGILMLVAAFVGRQPPPPPQVQR